MDSSLKSLRVLIVEDDRLMQKLIADVLAKLGFGQIYKAANGNAALSLLDHGSFDFVICDWRMGGGMDGIEFTKTVRASENAYAFIPIIMLTGNAEMHHVLQARDVGVNEYLIKPFTVKDLCSRLREIIDHPREFVLAPVYKGPSRRRRAVPSPVVPERRRMRIKPQARQATNAKLRRFS